MKFGTCSSSLTQGFSDALEDGDATDRLFNPDEAAAVHRHAEAGLLHGALPRGPAQLQDQLVDLGEACGGDGMSLGFETARDIDRDPAAPRPPPAPGPGVA